jgi:hypothetical protein
VRRAAAIAGAGALALLGAAGTRQDARACRLPTQALASHRDTAAWCAREFLIRNGYTAAPASADRDLVALEPTLDVGPTYNDMMYLRRNTVSSVPLQSCTTDTGYLVSFAMANQLNQSYGRGVVMTSDYVGITLLRSLVQLGSGAQPKCMVPRLPPPSP